MTQSILVRHAVKDYATWKGIFDGHAGPQAAAGLTVAGLWRNSGNDSEVVILFHVADMAKAQAFFGSDTLKQAMAAGGVVSAPEVTILNAA